MRKIISVFIFASTLALAQENWGPGEWVGGGSIFLEASPCFLPDTNAILIADGHPGRIYFLDIGESFGEQYLPESLSVDGYYDGTPFMSPDGNRLYFSSARPGGYGGVDIWMTEKIGGSWSLPTNLGPEINTNAWEVSPSLTADGSEIFFVRADSQFFPELSGYIYRSDRIDGYWAQAEFVPDPISIGFHEGSPAISGNGDRLYFNSYRPNGLEGDLAVWVSYRQNESWQEPQLLTNDINYYWWQCPPWALTGAPFSVSISHVDDRLLYNKIDLFDCIDLETNLFMARRAVSADENPIPLPEAISLSAYPNPFNSSMKISVEFPYAKGDLTIYDILGRPVKSFEMRGPLGLIEWRGEDVSGQPCASGIYFIKASSGNLQKTIKVGMIK